MIIMYQLGVCASVGRIYLMSISIDLRRQKKKILLALVGNKVHLVDASVVCFLLAS
jgi:hypothetical protein